MVREPAGVRPVMSDILIPDYTTIHVTAVQEPAGRKVDTLRVLGHRNGDLLHRPVEVLVGTTDAEELIRHAMRHREYPSIEVPSRSWAFVGVLGDTKFLYMKRKGDAPWQD